MSKRKEKKPKPWSLRTRLRVHGSKWTVQRFMHEEICRRKASQLSPMFEVEVRGPATHG